MAARFFARRTLEEVPTPKHKFEGHKGVIRDFVFLHDNIHIMSGSEDGTMRKWNCDTGFLVEGPWYGKGSRICVLALSPDGKMIACGREDGSVQRWNIDGKMIPRVWTGHSDEVWSLSWSPSGSHLASGSDDGTILIRQQENGRVVVDAIKTEFGVSALAYSPSDERIASGGMNSTICIWDKKTGKLVVGPIEDLGDNVTSLVWSSDSTKLYSASDYFARVFDSASGVLLHRFQHDDLLFSVALSPKHNVLACVGNTGVAQLWDTESLQPLGKPLCQQDRKSLNHVSFSPDGRHLAYGGDDAKLTLWLVKDIAPQQAQLAAATPLQQSDRQSTQQKTRPNSPSSSCLDADATGPNSPSLSCLDADATGGNGIIEEGDDDPYNNFFQSSNQSLPSASPGSHLPHLLSARRFLNFFSRHHPPADKSIPKESSKRKSVAHRAPSNPSLELATMKPNQPVPEAKLGEGKGEQGENVDDRGSANDSLGARKDKGKQREEPLTDAQSPPSHDPTPVRKDNPNLWERLMQARGQKHTFSSLDFNTRPANAPQPKPRRRWHWNSSLFPVGSSRCPVDVAACREDDRYGIVPESDAEAAAAMLRTSDNEADSPTRPGQPAVGAQASHGRPTQTQASTSGLEDIVYEGVSCCGFFFGYRRRFNLRQP